eukprot:6464483-Lingulodinium_polyedra.AAC.1
MVAGAIGRWHLLQSWYDGDEEKAKSSHRHRVITSPLPSPSSDYFTIAIDIEWLLHHCHRHR